MTAEKTKEKLSDAQIKAQRLLAAYLFFNTPPGELVMADLEKAFGLNFQAFLPDSAGSFCPMRAAVRDGQRSILLHLKAAAAKSLHEQHEKPQARKE